MSLYLGRPTGMPSLPIRLGYAAGRRIITVRHPANGQQRVTCQTINDGTRQRRCGRAKYNNRVRRLETGEKRRVKRKFIRRHIAVETRSERRVIFRNNDVLPSSNRYGFHDITRRPPNGWSTGTERVVVNQSRDYR